MEDIVIKGCHSSPYKQNDNPPHDKYVGQPSKQIFHKNFGIGHNIFKDRLENFGGIYLDLTGPAFKPDIYIPVTAANKNQHR